MAKLFREKQGETTKEEVSRRHAFTIEGTVTYVKLPSGAYIGPITEDQAYDLQDYIYELLGDIESDRATPMSDPQEFH